MNDPNTEPDQTPTKRGSPEWREKLRAAHRARGNGMKPERAKRGSEELRLKQSKAQKARFARQRPGRGHIVKNAHGTVARYRPVLRHTVEPETRELLQHEAHMRSLSPSALIEALIVAFAKRIDVQGYPRRGAAVR